MALLLACLKEVRARRGETLPPALGRCDRQVRAPAALAPPATPFVAPATPSGRPAACAPCEGADKPLFSPLTQD